MLLAKVINNEILEVGDSFTLFPNTSFPPNKIDYQFLQENSVMEVVSWENFDDSLYKLNQVTPYIKEGKVYTFEIIAKTDEELQQEVENKRLLAEYAVRTQRNQLLKDSDWTQTKDSPDAVDVLWQPYRQALRDITIQAGFPLNVVFPTPPL